MMIFLAVTNLDYGPMARHEKNAREKGDVFSGVKAMADAAGETANPKGKVLDLVLPTVVLIVACVIREIKGPWYVTVSLCIFLILVYYLVLNIANLKRR